jgi:hypothetical protein
MIGERIKIMEQIAKIESEVVRKKAEKLHLVPLKQPSEDNELRKRVHKCRDLSMYTKINN